MAGVEQLMDYLKNLKFTDDDIDYPQRQGRCSAKHSCNYLRNFKFECDVWAVPEGTPIFPHEPIVTVRGPVIQAQFIETMVLLSINHQSLIATKANRIVRAAQRHGAVMEFGTRRAHGVDAAIYGARAAYIAGCAGTACAIADRDHGITALGTMAHSWVQMYPDEYSAFKKYAQIYPDNCVLLVDTYNVLKSGVPAAIRVFKEMKPRKHGHQDRFRRRRLSDEKSPRHAGRRPASRTVKIVVSNSLDEYIIRDVILRGRLHRFLRRGRKAHNGQVRAGLSAASTSWWRWKPAVKLIPKIKISENVEKITNPGFKHLYRLYDRATGQVPRRRDHRLPTRRSPRWTNTRYSIRTPSGSAPRSETTIVRRPAGAAL